jgi:hypothetical protein
MWAHSRDKVTKCRTLSVDHRSFLPEQVPMSLNRLLNGFEIGVEVLQDPIESKTVNGNANRAKALFARLPYECYVYLSSLVC